MIVCPNVLQNRRQRLALWQAASGSLQSGLVSVGLSAWLLDCSVAYVKRLADSDRLSTRIIAGQRLIFLASVVQYCESIEKRNIAGRKPRLC